MNGPTNVIPLKGTALSRTRGRRLQKRITIVGLGRAEKLLKYEWDTVLGEISGLLDGTLLLRTPGRGPDIELSVEEARAVAHDLLEVALMCDQQRQILDGRAAWICWEADGRTWVRHQKQTMGIRLSRLRPSRRVRRCASCSAELLGEAWVLDRSAPKVPPYGQPMWWRAELCRQCVETKREAEVGG